MNFSSPLYDISYSLETPEGVDLHVELAGPLVRILAFTIDFLWRMLIFFILMIFAAIIGGKVGLGIWLLGFFLLEWFYPVFYEVLRGGQTPGKKSMGIMVINDDLTPVNWGTSITRNLLRGADFLPMAYLFGLLSMTLNGSFKRLGDITAGTLVIYKNKNESKLTLPDEKPAPPPFELSEEEQNAMVEFTLRHESLTEARQKELAGILEESFQKDSSSILKYLRGIGTWLLGAR